MTTYLLTDKFTNKVMRPSLTQEDFIRNAKAVHGDKYDYSKFVYVNTTQKVCIICPKHGEFWQQPSNHINQKQGCPKCYDERRRSVVLGFGINDSEHQIAKRKTTELSYKEWTSMIRRCYSPKYHKKKPTYIGCQVCDEWKYFSNFERWFLKNYKDGYVLDKDVLIQGNRVYSPNTCCFVPTHINCLLPSKNIRRGLYKLGVYVQNGKYVAQCCIGKVQRRVGVFDNEDDAHEAYKKAKYSEIRRVATEAYKNGSIDKRVYDALLNYKINEY